ncbi:MAG: heme exporter protein CcmB [bacterium JZ-2024 1]
MMRFLLTIIQKDLLTEWKGKETLGSSILFSLMLLVILSIALPIGNFPPQFLVGAFWITLFFSTSYALSRGFSREADRETLDYLLMAPYPRGMLFFSKSLAVEIFVLGIGLVSLLFFVIFFQFPLSKIFLPFLFLLFLSSWGLVVSGVFLGSLTARSRTREMAFYLIVYPFLLPLLMASARASSALVETGTLKEFAPWTLVFLFFDVFLTLVMYSLIEYILEG